jgi:predicted Ser/Thr protein kinase
MTDGDRLEDLASLWMHEFGEGHDVPAEELCADCPDLAPQLRRRLDMLRRMAQLATAAPLGPRPVGASGCVPADGAPRTARPTAPAPATLVAMPCIPGYEVLAELGRGGMGVVYKARQVGLNRLVALKMIGAGGFAGRDAVERFHKEAEAIARLRHPNIVQVYGVGEQNGLPYFSLEFIEGGTLAQKMAGKPLPAPHAAELVEVLARAVHAAHERGIVHRDLKPGNVLLAADGTPKVTDFGLAKYLDETGALTKSGDVLGTPSYMAPEQAEGRLGEIGPRTDVYALGAILYEALTGEPPFRGATPWDTVQQVRSHDPVRPSQLRRDIPRDLEAICLKCLRKRPADRYPSALVLAEDLERFRSGRPTLARPEGVLGRTWRPLRPYRAPAVAAAGYCTFVAVSVGILLGLFSITSTPVDHTRADVWVCSPAVLSVDLGRPIDESNTFAKVAVQPEVARTEIYMQGFAYWAKPRGDGNELCVVIGSRLGDDHLGDVDLLTPDLRASLTEHGAVVVDESELDRLGVKGVGDYAEITGHRARVVGLTKGIKSLAGPYVFCSVYTARDFLRLSDTDMVTYLLVKCHDPVQAPELARRLSQSDRFTAFTAAEFSFRSRMHWLTKTKAGIALGFGTFLGMVISILIIIRQLSATARDQAARLRGVVVSRWRAALSVWLRALCIGTVGVILGLGPSLGLAWYAEQLGVRVMLPPGVLFIGVPIYMLIATAIAGSIVTLRIVFAKEQPAAK